MKQVVEELLRSGNINSGFDVFGNAAQICIYKSYGSSQLRAG